MCFIVLNHISHFLLLSWVKLKWWIHSAFALPRSASWSRNMPRIWTWHHIDFHCLQPAPLTPTSAPRPVATVFGSIAQDPDNKEAEIREQRWSKLYVIHQTCTDGKYRLQSGCWCHPPYPRQGSWRAPSRFRVHIGVCKSLIRKEKIFGLMAPDPLWPSSPLASTSRLYRRFLCSRTSGSRNQISHTTPWTWWLWSRSVYFCTVTSTEGFTNSVGVH